MGPRGVLFWMGCVLSILPSSDSSRGDRDGVHTNCLNRCQLDCNSADANSLSWELRLFKWTCQDNCKHTCMVIHHANRMQSQLDPVKYYGKWHFLRVYGVQEPFSALFSLGNGLAHLHFFWNRNKLPKDYFMKEAFVMYSMVAMNTWIWSTLFHTRDTPLTEKLDYYFTTFHVAFSTVCSLIRVFGARSTIHQYVLAFPIMGLLLYHVNYMENVQFDYGRNMVVNLGFGVTYILTWVAWALYSRRSYSWKIVLCVILIACAAALEVFDFPPFWGLLDAHACWHACTIPLVLLFYHFVFQDGSYEGALQQASTSNGGNELRGLKTL